jgi:hypothetical protein
MPQKSHTWRQCFSRKAAKNAKNDRKKGFASFAALREISSFQQVMCEFYGTAF